MTGLVDDEAAASRAVSRMGAGRALSSFVRVGEWDFSVEVGKTGDGGGFVILSCCGILIMAVMMASSGGCDNKVCDVWP